MSEFEEIIDGAFLPMNVINGRINTQGYNSINYKRIKDPATCSFMGEAVGHQLSRNPLSDLYFSPLNVDALQNGMRNMVYSKTGEVIEKQSETELKIIMRSIFLQYARYRPDQDLVEQVKNLNYYVLDFSVKRIISSIHMKQKYLQDIEKLPVPLDRAQIMSTKGTKTLELKEF